MNHYVKYNVTAHTRMLNPHASLRLPMVAKCDLTSIQEALYNFMFILCCFLANSFHSTVLLSKHSTSCQCHHTLHFEHYELYFSSWSCTHYFNNRITTSMWKSPNIKAHYLLTAMFQKIKYYMEHKNDSIQCSHLVWMFEIWRKKNGAEFQVDVFIMQENNARSLGWIN